MEDAGLVWTEGEKNGEKLISENLQTLAPLWHIKYCSEQVLGSVFIHNQKTVEAVNFPARHPHENQVFILLKKT